MTPGGRTCADPHDLTPDTDSGGEMVGMQSRNLGGGGVEDEREGRKMVEEEEGGRGMGGMEEGVKVKCTQQCVYEGGEA